MTSTVASPTLLYPTNSPGPKQGILLNPYANAGKSPRHLHNSSLPLPSPHDAKAGRISAASSPGVRGASLTLPRTDSGSSTNSNTEGAGGHSRANSIRKIRFAPLPIPRAQEEEELAQMESPTAAKLLEDEGVPVTPGSAASHGSAGSSSFSGGILGLFNPTTGEDGSPDTASEAGSTIKSVSKAKSKHWSKRLFKPLLKPTSTSEKSGSISDDALWRPTSRDSIQSNTSNEGSPRTRRMTFEGRTRHSSIGSAAGAPLARVSSGNNPRRQRLLNGRVYGVNRAAFQNIKNEEPAFVEWGHGGAGSVNNRHGAGSSKYAGVQTGEKLSIGAIASPASSTAGGDEDDGSGMAWVRRRREQRERERREKEEQEQQQARQDTTTTTTSSITSDESEKDVLEMMPSPGTMGGAAGSSPSETPEEQHHIVTAIQVPAPPHAHAHPHTHAQHHDVLEKPVAASEQSGKSSSESSSSSSGEDEENETESEDDDEDDEDDEEENERRKTALGAGVEKISRHKEEQQ